MADIDLDLDGFMANMTPGYITLSTCSVCEEDN